MINGLPNSPQASSESSQEKSSLLNRILGSRWLILLFLVPLFVAIQFIEPHGSLGIERARTVVPEQITEKYILARAASGLIPWLLLSPIAIASQLVPSECSGAIFICLPIMTIIVGIVGFLALAFFIHHVWKLWKAGNTKKALSVLALPCLISVGYGAFVVMPGVVNNLNYQRLALDRLAEISKSTPFPSEIRSIELPNCSNPNNTCSKGFRIRFYNTPANGEITFFSNPTSITTSNTSICSTDVVGSIGYPGGGVLCTSKDGAGGRLFLDPKQTILLEASASSTEAMRTFLGHYGITLGTPLHISIPAPDPKNASYITEYGRIVTLKNGTAQYPGRFGGDKMYVMTYIGNEARIDINHDGREDIVLALSEYDPTDRPSNSLHRYFAVALNMPNGYIGTNILISSQMPFEFHDGEITYSKKDSDYYIYNGVTGELQFIKI